MVSEVRRTLPERSELGTDERWDIESVFASVAEWEDEQRRIDSMANELDQFEGNLGESSTVLLDALQRRDEVYIALWKLATYAFLRQTEDATNPTYTALADRAASFASQVMARTAFYEPEILAIDPDHLAEFMAENQDLELFRHYFEELNRRRAHTRSPEVEQVLASALDVTGGYNVVRGALENADLDLGRITDADGNTVQLGQGNLGIYLQDTNRDIRREAWTKSADAYLGVQHTFGATLAGSMKRDVFYARARNYETAIESQLHPDGIPIEVFHNLIDTVWENLPTWRRYFALRRRVLGLDELQEWDLTAPLLPQNRKIAFAESVDIIADSLTPLGEEYVQTVRQGIADRWVDPYPNIGKHGGAFSSGSKGTYPFISMNYTDDFESLSTLAHELGHSMHSYYTWSNQPEVYCDIGMAVAETASNMHQALLGKKMLSEIEERDFLIEIIEERMSNHLRYFFTMPILARFEYECHTMVEQDQALTASGMSEKLAGIYEEAYGGEVVVDPDRMGITWARFPHLYQAYYVFNYALGISAAAELSNQVIDEGQPAAERYIDFLKAGSSKTQIAALQDAGVDMRDARPIQAAFDVLAGYVDRLEELTS